MEIKRIGIKDAHLVITLFDQYRVFYKKPSDLPLAEKFIHDRLRNNESIIYVALIGGKPVGFTQLYPKYSSGAATKNWILNDLYVEADYRKHGIGRALINIAMEFARNDGSVFVQLETAIDNYTAQSLYESIGFVKQQPDEQFLVYRISL